LPEQSSTTNTEKPTETQYEQKQFTSEELLAFIRTSLEDAKAIDPAEIELKGKSSIADYLVIASGSSQRHVAGMAHGLVKKIKEHGFGFARAEGMAQADWVLIDAGDIIVHLFRPEVRDFYGLEKMWSANLENDAD